MNLLDCIQYAFPDARPGVDFTLIDRLDRNGPQIATWDYAGAPEPSTAQLQEVAEDAAREAIARDVRFDRDNLLAADDWLVQRHRDQVDAGSPTALTAPQYADLLRYRQALRDMPTQSGFPSNVDWPSRPI
ncbi:XkdW family protein [Cupriavidus pampae]|uniref:Phage tail protein n=1 Tax=Cupriavidus pampae TaxID=659251 RepID=A0ABN7YWS4_9BURK|nr:XkdW family protein [Cupriavidus pampae]CAG9177890.1 hypothetical protein LMG32289_03939 [Cupriavidus pampae]